MNILIIQMDIIHLDMFVLYLMNTNQRYILLILDKN